MSSDWFDLRSLIPPTLSLLDDDPEDQAELDDGPGKLEALDRHTKLFMKLAVKGLSAWKEAVPDDSAIQPPQREGDLGCEPIGFGDLQIPSIDEDWPQDKMRLFAFRVLRSRAIPLVDKPDTWDSPAEAIGAFQSILPVGTLLARPTHRWEEMSSDAAQSRLAFAGLGALRLLPVEPEPDSGGDPDGAAWVSDFAWMSQFDVREGFERYGAVAYFGADQSIVRIHWSHAGRDVRPGDADWEHAKWAWRCSLMVGTTVADHLVGVHWLIANYVTMASRQHLGVDHPLRRLLKPFTWRTIAINYSATYSLCPERGFVHRASALEYPSLKAAFEASVAMLRYQTPPELIARKRCEHLGDDFPWATDALALHEVIHDFVDDYVSLYFAGDAATRDPAVQAFWATVGGATPDLGLPALTRDALVDLLAQFIWCVTGLHDAVGSVIEYALDPTFTATKIRPGSEMADVQASIQCLLIVALTGLEMPALMGDFTQVCLDDAGVAAFRRFEAALSTLADRIDAANQRRRWPCNSFNPRHLETGVSI